MKPSRVLNAIPGHFYWLLVQCAIGGIVWYGWYAAEDREAFGTEYDRYLFLAWLLAFLNLIGGILAAAERRWFWVTLQVIFAIGFFGILHPVTMFQIHWKNWP